MKGLPNPSSKFVAVFGKNLAPFPFNGMVFLCHMITDSRFVVSCLRLLLWPGEMGLLGSFCFLFVFCFPDSRLAACFPYITLSQSLQGIWYTTPPTNLLDVNAYTGWPNKNRNSRYSRFFRTLLAINSYLFSPPCWIEHLFLMITTPRSSNLVENFLFYE